MFGPTFGASVSLSIAQTVFANSLKQELPKLAPNINPETIIAAGPTGLSGVNNRPDEMPAILLSYSQAGNRVFYFTASMAVLSLIFTWGLGWGDVREKRIVGNDVGAMDDKAEGGSGTQEV